MSDLLWRDNLGNTAMWFMNGTTIASSGICGQHPHKLDGAIGRCRVKAVKRRGPVGSKAAAPIAWADG